MLISLYPFRTTMVQITHMRHDNNNSADDLIQLKTKEIEIIFYYQVNFDYPPPTIRRGSAIKFLKLVSAHFSLRNLHLPLSHPPCNPSNLLCCTHSPAIPASAAAAVSWLSPVLYILSDMHTRQSFVPNPTPQQRTDEPTNCVE